VVNPLPDLSVSADFYHITLEDGITTLDLQQVFDNEAACAEAGTPCDPSTQGAVIRFSNNAVNFAYDPTVNATSIKTTGVDLDVNYKLPTSDFGTFGVDIAYSHVFSYKQKSDSNAPDIEKIDSISYPHYRLMGQVNWRAHNLAAALIARFVPSQKDCDSFTLAATPDECPGDRVASYTEFDAQASYHLPWRNEITFGIRNMFNRQPPGNQFYAGSSDPQGIITAPQQNGQQLYSFDGRVPYIRFTQNF
jgi:iron complex outermembrane receptor protein